MAKTKATPEMIDVEELKRRISKMPVGATAGRRLIALIDSLVALRKTVEKPKRGITEAGRQAISKAQTLRWKRIRRARKAAGGPLKATAKKGRKAA